MQTQQAVLSLESTKKAIVYQQAQYSFSVNGDHERRASLKLVGPASLGYVA